MFEAGELRLVMLLLMESEPRHGYDIIRELETRTGGAYAPSPGIVYPTLTMLEELGQVEARATQGAKKLYAITAAGSAHLAENRNEAPRSRLPGSTSCAARAKSVQAGPGFQGDEQLKSRAAPAFVRSAGKGAFIFRGRSH